MSSRRFVVCHSLSQPVIILIETASTASNSKIEGNWNWNMEKLMQRCVRSRLAIILTIHKAAIAAHGRNAQS
jgi:hypothetical protein